MDANSTLRIGIIASARFPIREPFAGGLEQHTHTLATRLRARGHDVRVFASGTSDPELGVDPVCPAHTALDLSEAARADVSMLAERFMEEHHAYLHLMLRLPGEGWDVIQNSSLHYLPPAMAGTLDAPLVTTLHTPPTPWLESAVSVHPPAPNASFVAVSTSTAVQWQPRVPVGHVIPNGVDLGAWAFRPDADPGLAVWTGRIVREKGPHLAIRAAHAAGLRIAVAGPVGDERYWREEVAPLLAADDDYVGHLPHADLAALVGGAGVALCTPCWEEPYGLVVAEALACGTPVAAFARGALPEILDGASGCLAEPDDVDALADAARRALALDRADVRRRAEEHCSVDVMVERYEVLYTTLAA
jgi:glycosyltransferase involved in cell wall biosynthesis